MTALDCHVELRSIQSLVPIDDASSRFITMRVVVDQMG